MFGPLMSHKQIVRLALDLVILFVVEFIQIVLAQQIVICDSVFH